MSMFTVTGEVQNIYFQPGAVDPETNKNRAGSWKVQIMGDMPVNGGGSKFDLITLTIPEGMDFEPHRKSVVKLPLGFFAPAKGNITYFIPKGSEIECLTPKPIAPAVSNPLVKSPLG